MYSERTARDTKPLNDVFRQASLAIQEVGSHNCNIKRCTLGDCIRGMPHKLEPQALVVPTTKHPHFLANFFWGNAKCVVDY
jgi:hypothetical protein